MKNLTLAVAFLALTALAGNASTQHTHQNHEGHEMHSGSGAKPSASVPGEVTTGPNGGKLTQLESLQVETLIAPGGIRLFAYDLQGKPQDLNKVRGLVMLQVEGEAKRYRYDLFPEINSNNTASSLVVAVDLSRIGGRSVELSYQLVGLKGAARKTEKFAIKTMMPMTESQQVADAIATQGVCPVSGLALGGMGKPVAVTVGELTLYVCCASCVDTVKSNPTKYFVSKPKLEVTEATQADSVAIAAQKLCPVMDEPLGGMGTPLKVTGLGRDVFLCCKGCLKFLEKEPQKYLAKLPPLAKPEVLKTTEIDKEFVAAQKVCPVMDEPLNAMGGPYKTVVEGRVVYLCCPGCAKKLHATPGVYLQKLADQGVVPLIVQ